MNITVVNVDKKAKEIYQGNEYTITKIVLARNSGPLSKEDMNEVKKKAGINKESKKKSKKCIVFWNWEYMK